MIIDQFTNAEVYHQIPDQILNYKFDLNDFKKGRFAIDGDKLFGIGLQYQTDIAEKGLWEAHRKYLDIHYILEGEEIVYVSNIANMKAVNVYQDDYQLFEGEKTHEVLLKSGDFMILYPHEVHKTSIINTMPEDVKKYVFKVLL